MSQYDFDKKEHDPSLRFDEFRWKGKVWKDLDLIEPSPALVYHPKFGFGVVHKANGTNVELCANDMLDGEECIFPIDEIRTERVGHLMEALKRINRVSSPNEVENSHAQMARVHIQCLIMEEPNGGKFCAFGEE